MIIEMRTYQLKPASLAEVEKRFGAALPIREKHSRLAAFWHTEIGPLNQIIHIWPYESFEQRAAVRAEVDDPAHPVLLRELLGLGQVVPAEVSNSLLLVRPKIHSRSSASRCRTVT